MAGDDLILTLAYTFGGAQTATLTVPRATRAGTGFPIPLPSGADATLRLNSLMVAPSIGIAGNDAWDVVALFGAIAKLLWILGVKRTHLPGCVRMCATRASSNRLWLLGSTRSAKTCAFHASHRGLTPWTTPRSRCGTSTRCRTAGRRQRSPTRATPSHPGTVQNASNVIPGEPGKYATGFGFLAAGGAVTIAPSTDFDIAANADATIEAFVKTDIPGDQEPRAIVVRRAAETAGGSTAPGWSLCVVNARGFNANILFALCDNTIEVRLFADLSVADGRFHHVAGIVDRTRKRARLFLDGVQRATAPIDTLGAIAPPDGVRFGSTAAATNNLSGTVDEVRISRIARATFHPALGEGDDPYRARLRIFRRWVLPTPANVIAMINEAAPFPSDPAPYVLIETNQPTQVAETPVRIVPATLATGTAIAVDGTTPQDETVAGTPADDPGFDPALDLITYAHAGVDSTSDPGGARMQAGTGLVLDALVARLAATPGTLVLEHSFDTTGPTPLHAVGRALRLRHQTMAADLLAALAHSAGFAYVRNLGPDIAVAVPAGERLAIRSAPAALPRVDVGSEFDLTVDPRVPLGGTFAWTIVTPGPGDAHFIAHSADPPLLQTLTTNATTAAANATLHFAAVPATILPGMAIADLTTGSVITAGTTVVSTTATTVVMSNNATGAGVGNSDSIQFRDRTPLVSRPRVRLVMDLPGDLAIRVEYGRGGRTRSGTLTLHIDPTTLADGHALDTLGNLDPDPTAIIGTPDPGIDATYLVTHPAQPTIDFGADPNSREMQVAARDALDALVALLAARATPGRLRVTQAFVPGGPGVESVGRRLILGHETLDPGVLGALASRFFDYVTRAGASVTAFVRAATWVAIGDATTAAPVPAEIVLGTPLNLAVVPGRSGP